MAACFGCETPALVPERPISANPGLKIVLLLYLASYAFL